jgi:hypothetical protein
MPSLSSDHRREVPVEAIMLGEDIRMLEIVIHLLKGCSMAVASLEDQRLVQAMIRKWQRKTRQKLAAEYLCR